jgi:hypothetical protein
VSVCFESGMFKPSLNILFERWHLVWITLLRIKRLIL